MIPLSELLKLTSVFNKQERNKMSQIFVESKPIPPTTYDHTYLVYRDNNGNEFVIRGGPEGIIGNFGNIEVQINKPIEQSKDARKGDTPAERGQKELDLHGRSAEDVWRDMQVTAKQIQDQGIKYDGFDDNSNSTARTIMERNGVTPTLPNNTTESDSPGWDDKLPLPPRSANDLDGDGIANEQDDDIDGDGIANANDPKPDYDFDDIDGDGILNENDADIDGDEIPNSIDAHPDLAYGPLSPLPPIPAPPTPPNYYADPLSLDLNRDGIINTLPVTNGIHFDLDNNGFAETTSWIAPTDGFVVLDKNANGKIEGGAELFGTETKLLNGQFAQNGFEALAEYDLNADGKINTQDAIFSQLRIWQDANSNGKTDAGELITLQTANITSLNARYTLNDTLDSNKVWHRESSTYTYVDGTTGLSETLWFEADKQNTIPVNGDAIVISAAIKALPDAKGFGNVYSLRQAMALDASGQLQQKVQAFVNETDIAKRKVIVNDILILWAGQQNTVAGSRGYYMDAKNDAHFARAA
jgi:hypothetical protein